MEDPRYIQPAPVVAPAPVPVVTVPVTPVAPAPTSSLLNEAYNRMMAPTATGTIAQRPAWAQARIDQANQAQTAGGGQVAQSGGGGGGYGPLGATAPTTPGQRLDVEGMRKNVEGMRKNVEGTRKDVEGTRTNVEGTRKDVEGTRLLPNLGTYKYDKMGRRIK